MWVCLLSALTHRDMKGKGGFFAESLSIIMIVILTIGYDFAMKALLDEFVVKIWL